MSSRHARLLGLSVAGELGRAVAAIIVWYVWVASVQFTLLTWLSGMGPGRLGPGMDQMAVVAALWPVLSIIPMDTVVLAIGAALALALVYGDRAVALLLAGLGRLRS